MSYLSVAEIKLGMTLNQVLASPDGKIVFGQGSIVNEQLLACLKKWKVAGVDVAEAETAEFSFAEIEKMVADIIGSLSENQSTDPSQAGSSCIQE